MIKEHNRGILAIIAAALLWSTGGIFIKLIPLSPMQISGIRAFFTLLTFLILFRRANFRWNTMTIFAGISYAGILMLFVAATKLTTAANAIFLQYTAPIYVLLLEPMLLGTKLKKINVAAIIVCFAGMSLFFFGKISTGNMNGNFIALASGISFASFLLLMRKNAPEYQLPAIFTGNIIIFLICLPVISDISIYTASNISMTAFLGVFQIGIAYALFSAGLKKVEAVEASLISMIEPVLNPVWVFIWYGEQPTGYAIAGGILILAAITARTAYMNRRSFA